MMKIIILALACLSLASAFIVPHSSVSCGGYFYCFGNLGGGLGYGGGYGLGGGWGLGSGWGLGGLGMGYGMGYGAGYGLGYGIGYGLGYGYGGGYGYTYPAVGVVYSGHHHYY